MPEDSVSWVECYCDGDLLNSMGIASQIYIAQKLQWMTLWGINTCHNSCSYTWVSPLTSLYGVQWFIPVLISISCKFEYGKKWYSSQFLYNDCFQTSVSSITADSYGTNHWCLSYLKGDLRKLLKHFRARECVTDKISPKKGEEFIHSWEAVKHHPRITVWTNYNAYMYWICCEKI